MIGPWDSRHFSRVTSGVRFCACGPCSVVMPRYQKRFCVWAAFCGAVLLTSMLVGCLCGPPSAPPSAHAFSLPSSHPSVLRSPNVQGLVSYLSPAGFGDGCGVGGGPWDNQQFGRATFGVQFCACGPCSVVMPRYQSGFVCGLLSAGLSC